MPPITGVDTVPAVTQTLIDRATNHLGVKPRFWGRYFGIFKPKDSYTNAEATSMAANGIRLLPIARQTAFVDHSREVGEQQGKFNVDDLVKRVGIATLAKHQGEILFFLDTEPKPVLNAAYFEGWASAIVSEGAKHGLQLAPAVYLHHNDEGIWSALIEAAKAGHGPRAAWVVAEHDDACKNPVPNWDSKFILPKNNPTFVPPCPIVVRQF